MFALSRCRRVAIHLLISLASFRSQSQGQVCYFESRNIWILQARQGRKNISKQTLTING